MTYTTHVNNYLTFVSEEDRERIRQVFKDVRANKVDKIKEEYRVHRPGKPDDSEDWMEARAFVEQYDEKGNLDFQVISEEGDYLFDEIGSVLKIKEYQETKKELLEALELYYRTFFLGENVDWEEEKESQEDKNKGEADEV